MSRESERERLARSWPWVVCVCGTLCFFRRSWEDGWVLSSRGRWLQGENVAGLCWGVATQVLWRTAGQTGVGDRPRAPTGATLCPAQDLPSAGPKARCGTRCPLPCPLSPLVPAGCLCPFPRHKARQAQGFLLPCWPASPKSFPSVTGGQPPASGSAMEGSRGRGRSRRGPQCPRRIQSGLQGRDHQDALCRPGTGVRLRSGATEHATPAVARASPAPGPARREPGRAPPRSSG